MKRSFIIRTFLPLAGLIMCSCETSGQLLTVDSGMGMAVGAVGVGMIASFVARLQDRKATA